MSPPLNAEIKHSATIGMPRTNERLYGELQNSFLDPFIFPDGVEWYAHCFGEVGLEDSALLELSPFKRT